MSDNIATFNVQYVDIGTFSVQYSGLHGISCAVDWNWRYRGEWARSDKEGDIQWMPLKGLDDEAHILLLDHFGLNLWINEFPIEKIILMSPAELIAARREKETKLNLSRKEAVNMTQGFIGISAENYKYK